MNNGDILDNKSISESKKLMGEKFPLMLQYFIEDTENYLQELKRGLKEKNTELIFVPAHTIKSSAKQIGAVALSNLAKEVEELSRKGAGYEENNFKIITQKIEQIAEIFSKTKGKLAEIN